LSLSFGNSITINSITINSITINSITINSITINSKTEPQIQKTKPNKTTTNNNNMSSQLQISNLSLEEQDPKAMCFTFSAVPKQKQLNQLPKHIKSLEFKSHRHLTFLSKRKTVKQVNLSHFERIEKLVINYDMIESMPEQFTTLHLTGQTQEIGRFLNDTIESLTVDHLEDDLITQFKIPSQLKHLHIDCSSGSLDVRKIDFSEATALEYIHLHDAYDCMDEKSDPTRFIDLSNCTSLKQFHVDTICIMGENAFNIPNLHLLTHLTASLVPQSVLFKCTSLIDLKLRYSYDGDFCDQFTESDKSRILTMPSSLTHLTHFSYSGHICVLDVSRCKLLVSLNYFSGQMFSPDRADYYPLIVGLDSCTSLSTLNTSTHLNCSFPSNICEFKICTLDRLQVSHFKRCTLLRLLFSKNPSSPDNEYWFTNILPFITNTSVELVEHL